MFRIYKKTRSFEFWHRLDTQNYEFFEKNPKIAIFIRKQRKIGYFWIFLKKYIFFSVQMMPKIKNGWKISICSPCNSPNEWFIAVKTYKKVSEKKVHFFVKSHVSGNRSEHIWMLGILFSVQKTFFLKQLQKKFSGTQRVKGYLIL